MWVKIGEQPGRTPEIRMLVLIVLVQNSWFYASFFLCIYKKEKSLKKVAISSTGFIVKDGQLIAVCKEVFFSPREWEVEH